ncbi:hypothetical protein EVAR_17961_1 [Eumeta japonica]|uniref:Uncharacterized protein n=1 Tax=Eumeta variegata TaxID=151549 RepID=A0A4C1UYA0_EUMVA|nr:hypothetical protein EVAR_17961_1 [Eumeta japonica]
MFDRFGRRPFRRRRSRVRSILTEFVRRQQRMREPFREQPEQMREPRHVSERRGRRLPRALRRSALVVVTAGHRDHLAVERPQNGGALVFVPRRAIPQYLRLVAVRVVRPVVVAIQH